MTLHSMQNIVDAAKWLNENRSNIEGPHAKALRERFGLTSAEAFRAIGHAKRIREEKI